MSNKYGYKNDAEDKWFLWQGQKPPERNPHLTEQELDEALANNLAGHSCDWKQNGAVIYCEEGDFEHGKRIGVNVRLAGTDEKNHPILVPVGPILRTQV